MAHQATGEAGPPAEAATPRVAVETNVVAEAEREGTPRQLLSSGLSLLTRAFAGRVVHTRFVVPTEPAGAWLPYDAQFPVARQPPDAPLAPVGTGPLVLAGVATDCCGLSTTLPVADAGAPVQPVTFTATDAVLGGR